MEKILCNINGVIFITSDKNASLVLHSYNQSEIYCGGVDALDIKNRLKNYIDNLNATDRHRINFYNTVLENFENYKYLTRKEILELI